MNKIQPKTIFTGKKSIYLPTCHSTNELASQKIQSEELAEGTIVLTDNQTHGKGQRGNKWYTAPGQNLTFTIVYKPEFLNPQDQFQLNIAVSLGIFKALKPFLGENELKIKWPNDVYVDSRKMGGMLIESIISGPKIAYSLIGIGLNINQEEFEVEKACSLTSVLYQKFSRETVLESILEEIEKEYLNLKNGRIAEQKERYLSELFRMEEWHNYRKEDGVFEGRIKGVTAEGRLLMETRLGLIQFGNKEFEYIL
ncbi:biotin--[acetyl-CoA-carboxylase] ligase [Jiulongibacter sp. NS-SX5]|uniref:biotin--[acetyl-CoA-carboxylase] ligase n=1 Tax=Jiulongibacter sp. NS-SX5 TaxID=3463854 RepID=UPI004059577C